MSYFIVDFISGSIYKQTHLEIDVNCKSDRIEWGHALYHSVMRPLYAYELVVQWLTASGTIVADLVGLHLVNQTFSEPHYIEIFHGLKLLIHLFYSSKVALNLS